MMISLIKIIESNVNTSIKSNEIRRTKQWLMKHHSQLRK